MSRKTYSVFEILKANTVSHHQKQSAREQANEDQVIGAEGEITERLEYWVISARYTVTCNSELEQRTTALEGSIPSHSKYSILSP